MLRIISISDSYCKILKIGIITCNIMMKKLYSLKSYPILVINLSLLQKCCRMFTKLTCQTDFCLFALLCLFCLILFLYLRLLPQASLTREELYFQRYKGQLLFKAAEISLYQIALEFNYHKPKGPPLP